jgi:phospholipase C
LVAANNLQPVRNNLKSAKIVWSIAVIVVLLAGVYSGRVLSADQVTPLMPGSDIKHTTTVTTTTYTNTTPPAKTPIKHIVIIVQENHSFDNYFGAFPGLAPGFALNMSVCEDADKPGFGDPTCVKPLSGDNISSWSGCKGCIPGDVVMNTKDLNHAWSTAHKQYDNGLMDGFLYAQTLEHDKNYSYTMGYYTNWTLPDYWDWATYFSLNANFFHAILAPSLPNHLYLVAGQSGNITSGRTSPDLNFPTFIPTLDAAGITWRYYAGTFPENLDCTGDPHQRGSWDPLPFFPAIRDTYPDCAYLRNSSDLLENISNGWLPNVAWVTPSAGKNATSEHPGTPGALGLVRGQEYTADIIDGIESQPALWNSTAIFLTWDDWDGYYDGVAPAQIDPFGFGFRVPLIVISPYVIPGSISYGENYSYHGLNINQEDFSGAFLSTIEYNWGLHNITDRDGYEPNLFYMFNFNQQPLQPLILPTDQLAIYPPATCIQKNICDSGFSGLPFEFSPGEDDDGS